MLKKSGLFLKVQWQQCRAGTMTANARGTCAIVLHAFCIAIFIRLNRLSRNTSIHLSLVQLMNIVSNLIFHCNHCDANTAFITIHESTAATPCRPSGLLNAKFTFKGKSPTNHFRTDSQANKCPTILSLTVFTQRNFLAEFIQSKCDFKRHAAVFAFSNTPLGRLGTTYDVHLGLIGKRVVDFLLVLIQLFALGVTVEALRTKQIANHTKKLCSRLSSSEVRLQRKNQRFAFLSPLWGSQGQRRMIILGSLESAQGTSYQC